MGTKKQLLDTPPGRVPEELARAVAGFCGPFEAITAAYVGLIEIEVMFRKPEEHLAAGFALTDAALESPEGVREVEQLAARFRETMPEEIQEGGCNVLDAGGAAAWAAKAVRVFER